MQSLVNVFNCIAQILNNKQKPRLLASIGEQISAEQRDLLARHFSQPTLANALKACPWFIVTGSGPNTSAGLHWRYVCSLTLCVKHDSNAQVKTWAALEPGMVRRIFPIHNGLSYITLE